MLWRHAIGTLTRGSRLSEARYGYSVHDFAAQDVVPELYLDLVFFDSPLESHWSISRHRHLYLDLDIESCLRWDSDLGEMFIGWDKLEAF